MVLTTKQDNFCKCIVEGMTQIDAYKSAYDAENMSDNAISVEASRLISNPNVSLRIKELRDALAKPTILSAQERLEFLTRVVQGEEKEIQHKIFDGEDFSFKEEAELNTKLKAIDLMNKMTGEYVTKVEGTLTTKLEELL